MKNHMYYDPFVEHDEMQKKFQEMIEEEKRFRETKTKFEIVDQGYSDQGDSSLEFTVKKCGDVDIRVSTWQDTKTARRHRCDLGHYHPVIERSTHYFNCLHLNKDEALALRDFLNERLKGERETKQ